MMDISMDVPGAFDLESFMVPFWEGNTVLHEAATVIQAPDGTLAAPLFYKEGVRILGVFDRPLQRKYAEGRDYRYENGMLVLPGATSCPYYQYEEYYPLQGGEAAMIMNDGLHYSVYEAPNNMSDRQLSVSYVHTDAYSGYKPLSKSFLFPKTLSKLRNGEELTIVYYGDSITEGYGSSLKMNAAPFMPDYPLLVTSMLRKAFPAASIRHVNAALCGTGIAWGIENVEERVNARHPDLAVLAFGMNDGGCPTAAQWTVSLERLMALIRAKNPDCEFMLVATMWANPELRGWNTIHPKMEEEMLKLEREGTAVAQVTSVHETVMRGKIRTGVAGTPILGYVDTSGNNVNHPNDFFTRIFAQTILAALLP